MLATELQAGKGNSVLPFPCLPMSVPEGKKTGPGKTGAFFFTLHQEKEIKSGVNQGRGGRPLRTTRTLDKCDEEGMNQP